MAHGRFRWEHILLALLLIALLWTRLELAASVPTLDYSSYSTVREADHITQTGFPLREDPLSVTGQERIGSPFFPYLLAGLAWISPFVLKILPNLFMVLLLIPVYAITRNITRSSATALVAVVLAGTGPFVFSSYLNDPSPVPIAAFLFLAILAMLHDPDRHLYPIVGLTLLLTFIHPIVFLLVLALVAIVALLRLEGFSVDRRIGELFFFTLFLAAWFHVLVYRRALLEDGVRVIWKNLPAAYASAAFGNVTFLTVLYGLGVIAFLFGVLGAYHVLFERSERVSLIALGAILATSAALLVRSLELRLGLVLLTLLLAVLAAYGLRISADYIGRTKAPWAVYPLGALLLILFLLTAFLPALANSRATLANAPGPEDIAAYVAAKDALPEDAVVLTTVREAAAFQRYSGRRTLTDHDFILVENGDEMVADIDAVYTARFTTSIVSKAQKLGFTHVLFSPDAERTYGRAFLTVEASRCLEAKMLTESTVLYTVRCVGEDP